MLRAAIHFQQEAANGRDFIATTAKVADVERLLRVAKVNDEPFIAVPTRNDTLTIVPLSNIAYVEGRARS